MIKNTPIRGYIWAFVAVIAVSNVYIFSKAALNVVHIAQFGFYWFALGLVWNVLFAAKTCKLSAIRNITFLKESDLTAHAGRSRTPLARKGGT